MNTHRILNAGCGRDLSIGTDFIDAAPISKKVIQCNMDCEMFPFKTHTFDEVVAFSVFEHLTNHAHFFDECYRVLKPNGILTITTDNAACLSFVFLYEHGDVVEDWREGDCHFGLFTPAHLANYAERFGFKKYVWNYELGKPPANPIKRIAQALLWKISQKHAAYSIRMVMQKWKLTTY